MSDYWVRQRLEDEYWAAAQADGDRMEDELQERETESAGEER